MAEYSQAAILLVQLILSVLSMPVTPLCWLYATRQLAVELRALASVAPAVWVLSFMALMPGLRDDLPLLLACIFWPSCGWYMAVRACCIAMLATIVVCTSAAYLALFLRWGRRAPSKSLTVQPEHGLPDRDELASSEVRSEEFSWAWSWFIRILEAVCVELAWRAYLFPRLLLIISPPVAVGVVGALSAASALPVAISFIQDHYTQMDIANNTGVVVLFYMLTVMLQSVCLAWLAVHVSFCVWPAAIVRLYWPSVLAQVSGIRSLTGLTDLANPGPGLVRGPRWKCTAEGASGVLILVPVAFGLYQVLLMTWDPAVLNTLFPNRFLFN